jgi:Putative adhesin
MDALLIVLAVIVVVLVVGLVLARRQAEQRTFTFDQPVRRVEADLRAGALSLAATDGPVRLQRTIRWAMARPVTSERVEDGVLRVEAAARRPWLFGEVSYRIDIPAAASVQASTGAGTIGVDGIGGDVDLRTDAGRVTLTNSSGRIRATTQAGQVQGSGLRSREVRAESNAGRVTLAFDAPPDLVEARTNAGSVELSVPDERYAVLATTSAGRAQVDVASDPSAPRRLVVHSNAGSVWVHRH